MLGGVPPQGRVADIETSTQATVIWNLRVPPLGGRYTGSCVGRYGDLNIQASEYIRGIHSDAIYYGPLSGGGAEAGIAGFQGVVVAGGTNIISPMVGGWAG